MVASDPSTELLPRQQTRKKYKDSCNNCAASKVKCNRDRPQCSRCEDRGLACNYSLSQRSGRRPTTSQATHNGDSTDKPSNKSKERLADDTTSRKQCKMQDQDESAPFLSVTPSFDPDVFGSIDMTGMMSWDSMPESLNSSGSAGGLPFDMSYTNYFPDLLEDHPGIWLTEGLHTDPAPGGSSEKSGASSILSETTSLIEVEDTDIQAIGKMTTADLSTRRKYCSTRAAEILDRLRSHVPNCCFSEPQNQNDQQADMVAFEDIVMVNRECIDAVMVMLKCPCSAEQQTVFMISMIVFEVLNRYNNTAMGCTRGASSISPTVRHSDGHIFGLGRYQIEGPDARRMRTALILGELHLVVRLLERLSQRTRVIHTTDILAHGHSVQSAALTSNPISASVFVQVQADMKKRMSQVRENLTQLMRQS